MRVHPTPLYELGAGLLIGAWLWMRGGKPRPAGRILGEYLVLSGFARFLVEFIRRNPKVLWGLSNAQLASAGSMLAGIAIVDLGGHAATGERRARGGGRRSRPDPYDWLRSELPQMMIQVLVHQG